MPAPSGYPIHGQVMIPPAPRNGMAVAALVLALAGVVTFGVTGPVGVILGYIARRRIRETGEQGETTARFGIIIGWVMTAYLIAVTALCVIGFMLPTVSTLNSR